MEARWGWDLEKRETLWTDPLVRGADGTEAADRGPGGLDWKPGLGAGP